MGWRPVISACAVGVFGLPAVSSASSLFTAPPPPGLGSPFSDSFQAVAGGDTASLGLRVYASPTSGIFLNLSGDSNVQRGAGFASIGNAAPGFGSYTVQAHWDEIVGSGTTNTLQVILKTSNSQRFIPAGATIQGSPVLFVEFRLGATNPVTFAPWITSINLLQATISASTNGGASFSTTEITAGVTNPWNGTSYGTTLPASFFNNANYIEANFVYTPIPAPSVFAAVGAGLGLFAARRRRPGEGTTSRA